MASANSSCAANSGITCVVQVTNIYEKNIDTANNTSVIHIDYQCVCTSDNYHTFSGSTRSNAGNMHVAVDGVWQSYTTVPINHGMSGGDVIASDSREITVSHNDDGSKTSSYYISMDSGTDERGAGYYWQTSSVGYDSITLTKITRDWTVSYDGAGGSTPSSQNKHYGTNITLGNSSRTGYTFQYWHGSDENNYSAGQTFTGNYALTLTAVWSINTWQVSFNANGGTNAPGNQTKTYGQTLTITTSVPTRTLYDFVSWSGSDGATYYPGSSFTGNYDLSLTANWKLAYVAPTITSLTAYHCTSDGTAADDGTYIKVVVGWKIDTTIYSDNQGSGITVTIDNTNVGTISISGTSGTASQVFGGSYNGDVTSTVSVYLYDTKQPGLGVSNSVLAQGATYLMDFSPDGNVCFGGAADSTYQICTKKNGTITWPLLANAGSHNSVFRGKDITANVTDGSFYTNIKNGTFNDIYIGDYFTKTVNGTAFVFRVAGLDVYLHRCDTEFTSHHAVIVPDGIFGKFQMNSSNTTAGGYVGSAMYTSVLPTWAGYLATAFGSNLLTNRELLSSAISGDNPSSWAWYNSKINLLTSEETVGHGGFGMSGTNYGYNIGIAYGQLPLFRLAPEFICNREVWWFRNITTAATFAGVGDVGDLNRYDASNTWGLRPRFLLG